MDVRKDVPLYYHDIKGKCGSIVRICLPALISFFCICLFLLLSFAIIESEDSPGGRIRTDMKAGFRLDHGFQVLQTGYPEALRMAKEWKEDAYLVKAQAQSCTQKVGPSACVRKLTSSRSCAMIDTTDRGGQYGKAVFAQAQVPDRDGGAER